MRTKEEIMQETKGYSTGIGFYEPVPDKFNKLLLEVLLDIRDLLKPNIAQGGTTIVSPVDEKKPNS